jgi:hypothetical protein
MPEVEAEVLPPETTDIITVVFDEPQIVLVDKVKGDAFLAAVRAETEKLVPDTTTDKGRTEIRSMAAKVTRSKTLVEKARLSLTAGLRQQVSDINEAGKRITGSLDALADEVRKPLTDWEDLEKLREARVAETIAWLKQAAVVTITDTAEVVRERGAAVFNREITKDEFGKRYFEARELQDLAVATLKAAMERLEQEKADRAELARLRKADEERAAQEAEARAAVQREEQRKQYARNMIQHIRNCGMGMIDGKTYPYVILIRELEEKVVIDDEFGDLREEAEQVLAENLQKLREAFESSQAEAVERAAREAADNAAREADEAAQREIDAANARAAEAERAAQAEREEREAEDRARTAAAQREADEKAKRERNRAHRAQVMGEIKLAIMAAGKITDEQAIAVVKAMVGGSIARVRVEF